MPEAVIVDSVRTPVGRAFKGSLAQLRPDEATPTPGRSRRRKSLSERSELAGLPRDELARLIATLEEEMGEAATELNFEYAARLRDEINDLRRELREAG